MRYYSYVQPYNEQGDPEYVITSEECIRKDFWSEWYKKMCIKYEQSYVDQNYTFEDCLDDWKLLHGASEVKLYD